MRTGRLNRILVVVSARFRSQAPELRLMLVTSIALACGMAATGAWIGNRLQEGVLQRAAGATVLNMDSIIKPLVQSLAIDDRLPDTARLALSGALTEKTLGRDVAAIKIWSTAGEIVYSNRPELIGRTYPLFSNLQRALAGQLVAEFDDLDDSENELERSLGPSILEVYAPIRETGTNRIIGVAEFYEIRENLRIDLSNVRLEAWAVVGSLTAAMIAMLSGLLIQQKRNALQKQVMELSRLLAENKDLQSRIRNAQHRMAEINELFLRRVSADLHDSPAQLLGFALLRLDALRPAPGSTAVSPQTSEPDEFDTIRSALAESLREIRTISAGLAPPELADTTLSQALSIAGTRHARRTGTDVALDIQNIPDSVDPSLKVCLYRFVQEGLNNAFRHAGGHGQTVYGRYKDGIMEVSVRDKGSQSAMPPQASGSGGLGLAGLRGRIEALGGIFEFHSKAEAGTRLSARFNIEMAELIHA